MLSGLFSCFRGSSGHHPAAPETSKSGRPGAAGAACQHENGQTSDIIDLDGTSEVQEHEPCRSASSSELPTTRSACSAALHYLGRPEDSDRLGCSAQETGRPSIAPDNCASAGKAPHGMVWSPKTPPRPRPPKPSMLLSLRQLQVGAGCGYTLADFAAQQASSAASSESFGESQPFSLDTSLGGGGGGGAVGERGSSDSSDLLSLSGLPLQLHFSSVASLASEVQDLQLLGRGGYGMVLAGHWRQEGRVAVKVLLSDGEQWMGSCYKEALLSKMLAHPNILQTYDFQAAVLTESDIARARASWELQQQVQQQLQQQQPSRACQASLSADASRASLGAEARADSFELLPLPSAPPLSAPLTGILSADPGSSAAAGNGAPLDIWQVLFMLGARTGQFLTLIIMEYAEVGTLQRAISAGSFREGGRLSRWAALRSLLVTAREIAGGMCLLHSYNIIHADLSATNVLLRCSRIDKRGFVAKVADFGLSKVTPGGVARSDSWAGQPQYVAPEVVDACEARLASDVFSFGVLLYEMVTGRKAFAEYHPAQILAGRLVGDLAPTWPADAPPALRALAERCMRHDPAERPSFKEVSEELRRQDLDAKAQHRQHTLRRRAAAEGATPAAALLAGAFAGGGGGVAPPPLRQHRLAAASSSGSTPWCVTPLQLPAAEPDGAAAAANRPCKPTLCDPRVGAPEYSSPFCAAQLRGSSNSYCHLLSGLPSGAALSTAAGAGGGGSVLLIEPRSTFEALRCGDGAAAGGGGEGKAEPLYDVPFAVHATSSCPPSVPGCGGTLEPITSGEQLGA